MRRYPLWYIPLPPHSDPLFGEGCSMAPDIRLSIFMGRAMVLGESFDQLARDLDLPWIPVGDLFHMQMMTALLDSAAQRSWRSYLPPRQADAFGPAEDKRITELRDDLAAAASMPWQVSEVYDNPQRKNFDTALPAEQAGENAAAVRWRDARMRNGTLDLAPLAGEMKEGVIYARTRVVSPQQVDAVLMIRSDDAFAVWVNGREVHRDPEGLGWMPGEQAIPVTLREGRNDLLVKVSQHGGGWTLGLRVAKPGTAPMIGLRFGAE
jgi:hypothetical protein